MTEKAEAKLGLNSITPERKTWIHGAPFRRMRNPRRVNIFITPVST